MSNNFHQILKDELSKIPMLEPEQTHLNETLSRCRAAYKTRRQMRHISVPEMILSQFRFIARPIWALQAIVLLIMCFFIRLAAVSEQAAGYLPAFISLSAVFVAMTMLPFYGRSRRYMMCEIESATRVASSRLILAKLSAVGAGDAVCLGVVMLLALGSMAEPFHTVLAFIVMPFLLACVGSLFILNRTKESYGVWVSAGYGTGLCAAYWTLALRMGEAPERLSTVCAAAVCILLLTALCFECRRLLRPIPSPDLQEIQIY